MGCVERAKKRRRDDRWEGFRCECRAKEAASGGEGGEGVQRGGARACSVVKGEGCVGEGGAAWQGGACGVPLLSSSPMSLAIIVESLPLMW